MVGKGTADLGMVNLISANLFDVLEEKRYTNPSYQFSLKIRFLEVANEEAADLLQPGGSTTFGKQHIKTDEWEGPYVQGIHWVPIPSPAHLVDFFKGGCRNVKSNQNEFGKMRDKAT